jgi:WD40 repeat protein
MGFSPYGKQIVVGSSKLFSQVFDAETGRLLHTLKSDDELGCDGCSTALTISPNNKYVFTMSSKLDGILWDLKSGKKLAKYGSVKSRPDNIVFSNDEKYLLLSFDEHLQIYNLKTTQKILDVTNKWIEYYEFKFYPILNQIILPSKNNTVIIWDADKHKKV